MVPPLIVGGILLGSRIAAQGLPLAAGLGRAAKIGYYGSKFMGSGFGFGATYSLGTYVGFPGNYQERKSSNRSNIYNITMPFGYYPRRRYSRRYSRYSRYGRRYSRYYRRY